MKRLHPFVSFIALLMVSMIVLPAKASVVQELQADKQKEMPKESDSVALDDDTLSYEKLQTKADIRKGLFNVYGLDQDYYFEVPDSLLSKDLLIVNKISSVPYALNGHGLNKG